MIFEKSEYNTLKKQIISYNCSIKDFEIENLLNKNFKTYENILNSFD